MTVRAGLPKDMSGDDLLRAILSTLLRIEKILQPSVQPPPQVK